MKRLSHVLPLAVKRFPHVLLIGICLLALSCGTALAKRKSGPTYVPPNQSAASQYTEAVPTAGGNTPSSGVGGGGGSGGSSGSTGASGSGSIPAKTLSQLDHQGSAGAAAAALARSLAPRATPSATPAHATTARTATAHTEAGAPAAQLIKTLGGSDAGGGIGFLLPVILVLSLVGASVLGLLRIRRAA